MQRYRLAMLLVRTYQHLAVFGERVPYTLAPQRLIGRRDLSVQALSWVFEYSESRLAARHVLLSIANHAKADGTDAWPSIPTIAHESRLSCREVYRCIDELIALGELRVAHGGGRHRTNLYSLKRMTSCQGFNGETVTSGPRNPDQLSPEPSLTVNKRNRHSAHAAHERFPYVDSCGKRYRISVDGTREYPLRDEHEAKPKLREGTCK